MENEWSDDVYVPTVRLERMCSNMLLFIPVAQTIVLSSKSASSFHALIDVDVISLHVQSNIIYDIYITDNGSKSGTYMWGKQCCHVFDIFVCMRFSRSTKNITHTTTMHNVEAILSLLFSGTDPVLLSFVTIIPHKRKIIRFHHCNDNQWIMFGGKKDVYMSYVMVFCGVYFMVHVHATCCIMYE